MGAEDHSDSLSAPFRQAIAEYIRREALPVEKYGHQPRLYALTRLVGEGQNYDDDVVFAAAWLHDLGVFIGHRPEDPQALAEWDNVRYAIEKAPAILEQVNFPDEKVAAVIEAIRTHQPHAEPLTIETTILRDADILEQLGALGILRQVCKVGRDTRYPTFTTAVEQLRGALEHLPKQLRLPRSLELAAPKLRVMEAFLDAVDAESLNALY